MGGAKWSHIGPLPFLFVFQGLSCNLLFEVLLCWELFWRKAEGAAYRFIVNLEKVLLVLLDLLRVQLGDNETLLCLLETESREVLVAADWWWACPEAQAAAQLATNFCCRGPTKALLTTWAPITMVCARYLAGLPGSSLGSPGFPSGVDGVGEERRETEVLDPLLLSASRFFIFISAVTQQFIYFGFCVTFKQVCTDILFVLLNS